MRTDRIMILVAALAALVVAATASAAKQSSSLTLVVLGGSPTAPAASAPTQGGEITFDVNTTQTDRPSVNVRCYQNGSWVYDGWQSFWPGAAHDPVFTLSSNYWTSGAAECSARLVYYDRQGRLQTLATTGFHVDA